MVKTANHLEHRQEFITALFLIAMNSFVCYNHEFIIN